MAIQCLQTAFNIDVDNPELLPSRSLLDVFSKADKEPVSVAELFFLRIAYLKLFR